MSKSTVPLVVDLVRGWVALYTRGLPSEVQDGRRAEIESDLWEHKCDASENGYKPDQTAWPVLGRWLLGIPADLSWRFEQIGAQRRVGKIPERSRNMNASVAQKGFLGVAVLMAALYLALGVWNLLTSDETWAGNEMGTFGAAMLGFVPAAIIVAGLWIQNRVPLLGSIVVLVGAVPLAVALWWTILAPILALLIVVFWFGARRFARERGSIA